MIVDYIRPMLDFNSLEELKEAIADDIKRSHETLAQDQYSGYAKHDFFKAS